MGDKDRFADAVHLFCAALHYERIQPQSVVVTLPADDWFKLQQSIERHMRGFMTFDGRGQIQHEPYVPAGYRARCSAFRQALRSQARRPRR
jgi:hypothetical protein